MAETKAVDPTCGCYVVETEWRDETETYIHKGKPMIHYCPKHAAAPELYEALYLARHGLEGTPYDDLIKQVDAALALAKPRG